MDSDESSFRDVIQDGAEQPADDAARAARLRAAAVRFDTQPALLTAARRLRLRLPGDEKFGDPLSTAGVKPVQVIARSVSALRPERDSLVKELGLAGLQVWGSTSRSPRGSPTPRKPTRCSYPTQLERIDVDGLSTGRPKRLKADGAPRDLHVIDVSRA